MQASKVCMQIYGFLFGKSVAKYIQFAKCSNNTFMTKYLIYLVHKIRGQFDWSVSFSFSVPLNNHTSTICSENSVISNICAFLHKALISLHRPLCLGTQVFTMVVKNELKKRESVIQEEVKCYSTQSDQILSESRAVSQ